MYFCLYSGEISEATIKRLPIYYRNVCSMEAEGFDKVTSSMIAERSGNTGVQVRQDFFSCGGAPKYEISELKFWLEEKLGLQKKYKSVIVGAGNLGRAILNCDEYKTEKFFICAAFDNNLMFEGMEINGVPVLNVRLFDKYLKENEIDIVIIATPASAAEKIFGIATDNKIKGVWNFASVDLKSTETTQVSSVHISDSLMTLSFKMHTKPQQ